MEFKILGVDMDVHNVMHILETEGATPASHTNVSDAWAPYESKLVKQRPQNLSDYVLTYYPFCYRCSFLILLIICQE